VLALSLDPKSLLDSLHPYGEIGLILIIFAETGLLIGLILPGDSLLFTGGLLASQGHLNIAAVAVGAFVAAVLGNQTGYWLGHRWGPALFRRPDSRFFKQEYVQRSHTFFEEHGSRTIVLARFIPVVRTIVPILAGVGEMNARSFLVFNVVGAAAWAVGVSMAGYALGSSVSGIDSYILPIVAVIVVLSAIPPFLEWRRQRGHRAAAPLSAEEASAQAAELHAAVEDD